MHIMALYDRKLYIWPVVLIRYQWTQFCKNDIQQPGGVDSVGDLSPFSPG